MIKASASGSGKSWFAGPCNSGLPVALGCADRGVDDVHVHHEMCDVYLVARGTSTAVVEGVQHKLPAGDMLIVEPGETHTFTESSSGDLHFVVPAPFVTGDKRIDASGS